MFTSNLDQAIQLNTVKSHIGVDLSSYNCHKLEKSDLYSDYPRDDLHYVIGAIQKGLKPHSKRRLERLTMKNLGQKVPRSFGRQRLQGRMLRNVREAKKTLLESSQSQTLNPQSPEAICMKALRRQFLQQIQKDHKYSIKEKTVAKSPKIVKRKENQKKRRHELTQLVKKYKAHLEVPFGPRLHVIGRCPQVSRKQIKDYLLTRGIIANTDPVILPPRTETGRIPTFQQYMEQIRPKVSLFEQQSPTFSLDDPLQRLNFQIQNGMMFHQAPNLKDQDFPSLSG